MFASHLYVTNTWKESLVKVTFHCGATTCFQVALGHVVWHPRGLFACNWASLDLMGRCGYMVFITWPFIFGMLCFIRNTNNLDQECQFDPAPSGAGIQPIRRILTDG
ncbi:hypothetical protein PanWU01x14_066660 [Parasponia andersonii]|uniref:Transmembrane protein n=1 Tax=Parasponia andersonii TaxID=3476 RepID=A0A2P5DG71_PARAD|nr:hypothetical protein PanWU01x14_066660 [Parasponia andersonii]